MSRNVINKVGLDDLDSSSTNEKEGGDNQRPKSDVQIMDQDKSIASLAQIADFDNTQAIDDNQISQRTGSFEHNAQADNNIQFNMDTDKQDPEEKQINLRMPKPFKRDKTLKKVFDKKKIVKQIQMEQKERYSVQDKSMHSKYDKELEF